MIYIQYEHMNLNDKRQPFWYINICRHGAMARGIDPIYCQTSNISGTSANNKVVDHSDVVGASPFGAAPTTSSFLT